MDAEQLKEAGDIPKILANYELAVRNLIEATESAAALHSRCVNILKVCKDRLYQNSKMKKMDCYFNLRHEELSICIWSNQKILFAIPISMQGMLWSRVLLFVESVCGTIQGKYVLKDISRNDVNPELGSHIFAGDYFLEPLPGSAPVAIQGKKIDIVPSGPLGSKCSSLQSSSASSPKHSAAVYSGQSDDDGSQPPVGDKRKRCESDSESNSSDRKFVTNVYQRDNHCVITRSSDTLDAAHILAHGWWNNTTNRRTLLPQDIVNCVNKLPSKIDDIRNGLLLRKDLAFDLGFFSLQHENGHYRVVALHPNYEEIDGVMLDENTRLRSDGSTCWGACGPHPQLVAFHLRNSVLARLVAAESDESDGDYCEDE